MDMGWDCKGFAPPLKDACGVFSAQCSDGHYIQYQEPLRFLSKLMCSLEPHAHMAQLFGWTWC